MTVMYYVLGAMIGYFVFTVVAAISNMLFGLLLGYRILSISFCGLMLRQENGKYKFTFSNVSITPLVQLEAKIASKWKKIFLEIGTIILGIPSAIGIYLLGAYQEEAFRPLWEKTALCLGFFLVVNLIVVVNLFIKMFGNSPSSVFYRERERVLSMIHNGVHPKDIQFNYDEQWQELFKNMSHRDYDLLRYYNALELNDVERIQQLIPKMSGCIGDLWSESQIPLFYELIYYYSAVAKDLSKAESYAGHIMHILEKDKDVNGRRVYAAYLYYTAKPKKLALSAAKEGLQVVDKYPYKGIAYMERDILNDLVQKIEGDLYERNI